MIALLAATAVLAGAPVAPEQTIHLSLAERVVAEHFVDTGKRGMSPGDRNIVRSQILDDAGKRVGRADIDCVVTGSGKQLGGLCNIVMTLRDGQIVGEFAWGRSGSSRYQAILGGTGRYAGMRGQAIGDTHGTDEHEAFTVDLAR